MPLFDYKCEACGHEFEALQKMNADDLVECPECHEPKLKKQIGLSDFRLKGTGWYANTLDRGKKLFSGD